MFSKSKEGQNAYYEAKSKLYILNLLKEEEHFLKENTSEPESLVDIQNRQGISHGLTNITDCLYSFFILLTEKSLNFFIYENLLTFGKDMYIKCVEIINRDENLKNFFSRIVRDKISSEQIIEFDQSENSNSGTLETIEDIFKELTEKYITVLLAQFRRDVKTACKIEKKMAHRKQIKLPAKHKIVEKSSDTVYKKKV
jgi:hypothetical protein